MIRGICHTNLDNYQHALWPTEFVAVPEIGSSVESNGGAILKVVGITHTTIAIRDYEDTYGPMITHEPCIKIELNNLSY